MKRLDELGISPTPWSVVPQENNGAVNNAVICPDPTHSDKLFDYEIVVGTRIDGKYDFDDPRHEAEQVKFLANAFFIAASPKLYEALYDAWERTCISPSRKCEACPYSGMYCNTWRAALAEAAGESEVKK